MRSQMCVQLHSVMPFCWRVDDYGCNHITCERGGYQTASNNKIIIANIMYNNHSRTDHIVGLCGVHIVDWLRQPVMQWIRRIRVCYFFFFHRSAFHGTHTGMACGQRQPCMPTINYWFYIPNISRTWIDLFISFGASVCLAASNQSRYTILESIWNM